MRPIRQLGNYLGLAWAYVRLNLRAGVPHVNFRIDPLTREVRRQDAVAVRAAAQMVQHHFHGRVAHRVRVVDRDQA